MSYFDNDLSWFIKTSRQIIRTENPRCFYVVAENGKTVAFIWFKWALNGWNIRFDDEQEKINIETQEQLIDLLKRRNMAWSKVKSKQSKPLRWWRHKILCEFWYWKSGSGIKYYKHLNKLCKLGFNLYGEKIN